MEFVTKYKVVGYDYDNKKVSQILLEEHPDEIMLKSIISTCKSEIAYFEIMQINQVVYETKIVEEHHFTDDELTILRNIPKEYQYISRDPDNYIIVYTDKPLHKECADKFYWECSKGTYQYLSCFEHLFKDIKWTDEEPVKIDDYVVRS